MGRLGHWLFSSWLDRSVDERGEAQPSNEMCFQAQGSKDQDMLDKSECLHLDISFEQMLMQFQCNYALA